MNDVRRNQFDNAATWGGRSKTKRTASGVHAVSADVSTQGSQTSLCRLSGRFISTGKNFSAYEVSERCPECHRNWLGIYVPQPTARQQRRWGHR